MVQEVQTSVNQPKETTLETIEAIGTSSFKIVEWRQTKGWHYVSWAKTTWWYYQYWASTSSTSPISKIAITLDSDFWKYDYSTVNGWLRVPVAWTYEIEFSWYWWSSLNSSTIFIKNWTAQDSPNLYTNTFWNASSEVKTITVDLGKFDIITAWGQVWIYGGWWYVNGRVTVDYIKITQL